MVRAIPVADVKITIRRKGYIRRNEIDRMLRVCRIFTRIAVRPESFSLERGLHDLAAIDVAVIENFPTLLRPQAKAVRSTSKLFSKCANEFPIRVVHDHGLAAHAGLINCVSHIDMPLRILREAMRVSPNEPVRRLQPIVDALVSV